MHKLEQDCSFSNGYIRKLKGGNLPYDRLVTVANYLDTTPEFLSTGLESTNITSDTDMQMLFWLKGENEELFEATMQYIKQIYRIIHPDKEEFIWR